mmetsp:Transcript_103688/g.334282  ORF Transcript_103688/g.334282 Transcript_103688/m.334282 type:complete len:248 (+) Transcript_103688:412-1155(+)
MTALLLQHLRRHPVHRADCGEGERADVALRATKVRELHVEVEVDQDVGALEVAVDNRRVVRVQVVQASERAPRGLPQHGPLDGAKLIQHVPQRAASNVLEVDVEPVVDVLVPEAADDVRVAQVLADVKLLLQLVAVLPILLLPLVDPGHLHCEDAPVGFVLGQEDAAVRAEAYLLAPPPEEGLAATPRSRLAAVDLRCRRRAPGGKERGRPGRVGAWQRRGGRRELQRRAAADGGRGRPQVVLRECC